MASCALLTNANSKRERKEKRKIKTGIEQREGGTEGEGKGISSLPGLVVRPAILNEPLSRQK